MTAAVFVMGTTVKGKQLQRFRTIKIKTLVKFKIAIETEIKSPLPGLIGSHDCGTGSILATSFNKLIRVEFKPWISVTLALTFDQLPLLSLFYFYFILF
jgi:hypothetical protein